MKNVAVVTGGSRGIGLGVAKALVEEGIEVWLTGRDEKKLKEVAQKLKCNYIKADMRKKQELEKLVETVIKKSGRIDILVNNAGIGDFKKLDDYNYEEIAEQIETNVIGLIYLTRLVVPYMKMQREGKIINISSSAGKRGFALGNVYCASKFAVTGFGAALFEELKEYNIKVSTVFPGSTKTDFFKKSNFVRDPEVMLEPKDIADAVLLCVRAKGNAVVHEVYVRSIKR